MATGIAGELLGVESSELNQRLEYLILILIDIRETFPVTQTYRKTIKRSHSKRKGQFIQF